MANAKSEDEDWDSEIELEEIEEEDVNDDQRTEVKDFNGNLETKGVSPVKDNFFVEDSDEEVLIEEVRDEEDHESLLSTPYQPNPELQAMAQ